MKFLVDAQLPSALCKWIEGRGHQAVYAPDVLPGDTPDSAIAAYAAANQLIVITKDEDFYGLRTQYDYALLWLRCGNLRNAALSEWLSPRWPLIERLLSGGEKLMVLR
jgi:predicted nuclease of predicted toxin-antitoxin system